MSLLPPPFPGGDSNSSVAGGLGKDWCTSKMNLYRQDNPALDWSSSLSEISRRDSSKPADTVAIPSELCASGCKRACLTNVHCYCVSVIIQGVAKLAPCLGGRQRTSESGAFSLSTLLHCRPHRIESVHRTHVSQCSALDCCGCGGIPPYRLAGRLQ